jgi:hypothetical protein
MNGNQCQLYNDYGGLDLLKFFKFMHLIYKLPADYDDSHVIVFYVKINNKFNTVTTNKYSFTSVLESIIILVECLSPLG